MLYPRGSPLLEAFRGAELDLALREIPGRFECPVADCGFVIICEGERFPLICQACGRGPFCSHCRQPYHYALDCAEVQGVHDRYYEWVNGDRDRYAGQARRFAKSQEAQKRAVAERRDRQQQLVKDEDWKAKRCRCCPHCGRVVEKLDGCNAMRCGYDTDSKKNKQDGCGRSFQWDKALPYSPRVPYVSASLAMIAVRDAGTESVNGTYRRVDGAVPGGTVGHSFYIQETGKHRIYPWSQYGATRAAWYISAVDSWNASYFAEGGEDKVPIQGWRVYRGCSSTPAQEPAPVLSCKGSEAPNDWPPGEEEVAERNLVHTGFLCDLCEEQISGLRFRCINCPAFNVCTLCEAERIAGGDAHARDHVFEIVRPPQEARDHELAKLLQDQMDAELAAQPGPAYRPLAAARSRSRTPRGS